MAGLTEAMEMDSLKKKRTGFLSPPLGKIMHSLEENTQMT